LNMMLELSGIKELEWYVSEISMTSCVVEPSSVSRAKDVVRNLRSTHKNFIVLLPKDLIPDIRVVKLAAFLTFRSFEKGINISKHVPIQFLLNLFATRQIRNVMKLIDRYWGNEVVAIEIKMPSLNAENLSLIRSLRQNGVRCDEVKGVRGNLSLLASSVYGIHSETKAAQYQNNAEDRSDYLIKSILTKIAYFGAISLR